MEQQVTKVTLNGNIIFQQNLNFTMACMGWLSKEKPANTLFSSLQISPNPARNELIISSKNGIDTEKYSLKIFDVMGRMILQNSEYQLNEIIDIQLLPVGIYQVALSSAKGRASMKFVKE